MSWPSPWLPQGYHKHQEGTETQFEPGNPGKNYRIYPIPDISGSGLSDAVNPFRTLNKI
jgi:hypothetical protein